MARLRRPRAGENLQAQWQAKKAELETHVSHARDQLDQANERIKERTGRDLVVAIGVGLLIGGGVILASLLVAKWSFVVIGLAIILLAVWELVLALRAGGRKVDLWPHLVLGAGLAASGYFADPWLCWVMLFVAVFGVIVWRLLSQMIVKDGRTYGDVLTDALAAGFVQVYVPFLGAIVLMLLHQPAASGGCSPHRRGGRHRHLRLRVGGAAVRPRRPSPDGAAGQPEEDVGGLRGCRARLTRSRCPRRRLHAGRALVGRSHPRRGAGRLRHDRRPRGVAAQARSRHQGHELLAARPRRSAGPSGQRPALRGGGARLYILFTPLVAA